ncbi:MAG: metallophosphoesterase [Cyanobacteria bacterium CAN_BIN43]|nr:metallophosphoesterase [Cyanobacteria bacterium CAN_BIN43]
MHRMWSSSLSVERITIEIAGLPESLEGTKVVQLSDLHYDGLRLSEELLAEAIATSNRAKPDLVVLTGDYITDSTAPIEALARSLQQLQSQLGTYAVLGNHDHYRPGFKTTVTNALTQVGIHVLWNQIAYPWSPRFPLVGLADFWSREFDPASVFSKIPASVPRLVLSHNPDTAMPLQSWRVDLQLSGHTHGGQIVIPGLGPVLGWLEWGRTHVTPFFQPFIPFLKSKGSPTVRHWEWSEGLHSVGTNTLYVNRGLGTYAPGRLFCPPEVTIFTLIAKAIPQRSSASAAKVRH